MEIAFLQICNDLHCIYKTLQYVLQMSTVLLETDLKTACKVINHSYTHSFLVMALVFCVIAYFSSGIALGLFSYT